MKILHIVTYAAHGGAGIAARRLHQSLSQRGIKSYVLCTDLHEENILSANPVRKLGSFCSKLYNLYRLIVNIYVLKIKRERSIQFSLNGRKNEQLNKYINQIQPDIIHLHWINDGFIDVNQLAEYNKPVVWSCHDMWAFTGGCHYNGGCMKWKQECTNCPLLEKITNKDIARKEFETKKEALHRISNLIMIGLSNWMNDSLKESAICKNIPTIHIPNTIDDKTYKIIPKNEACKRLHLDNSAPIVLFGAMDISDTRKGLRYLIEALTILKSERKVKLIAVGNNTSQYVLPSHLDAMNWGKASDKEELSLLYSAADVVVLPSIQENLSNMIIESLLCGTPVVCFNIGGNSDMIIHKENGYLSNEITGNGLAIGINWLIENPINTQQCRNSILHNFDNNTTVEKYIELYNNLIL